MLSLLATLMGVSGIWLFARGFLSRSRRSGTEQAQDAGPGEEGSDGGQRSLVCGSVLVALAICCQGVGSLFVFDDSIMTRTTYFRTFYWVDFLLTCAVAVFVFLATRAVYGVIAGRATADSARDTQVH